MVCERVRCATGCSRVDWFLMDILGGRAGDAVGLPTLEGWAGLFTEDGGGAVAGGRWAITLGATGGFTLGSGWLFCFDVEYGVISGGGIGRKMSRTRVRASKSSVCSLASTSLIAHDRKFSAWTMRSSGVTVG